MAKVVGRLHNSMELICQVTCQYFCAGVVIKDGVIIATAPILKWSKGQRAEWFRECCRRRQWDIRIAHCITLSHDT